MTLDELQKICDEVTDEPWDIYLTDEDHKFIAAARTYMPILIEIARVAALFFR